MKSLIKGLLTDIETRFGYEDLIKHAFFKGVTWTSLKNGNIYLKSSEKTFHFCDVLTNFYS